MEMLILIVDGVKQKLIHGSPTTRHGLHINIAIIHHSIPFSYFGAWTQGLPEISLAGVKSHRINK
jgi:hypothetical protein